MLSNLHEAQTTHGDGRRAAPRILLVGDPPSRTGIAGEFRSALSARAVVRGWQFEEVIIDETVLKPCTGCLACYWKNGGNCVHPDGFRPLRDAARRMDCVVLLTEITFGQASVAIKQAIDKGIGVPWGLCGPFPAQLVVGYGWDLAEDEASCFLDIVRRHVGKAEELHRTLKACAVDARVLMGPGDIDPSLDVLEELVGPAPARLAPTRPKGDEWPAHGSSTSGESAGCMRRSVILLNGSLRGQASTSHFLLNLMEARINGGSGKPHREALSLGSLTSGVSEFAARIEGCDALVIALPLFCYCVPAGLLRLLVELNKRSTPRRAPELFAIVYSGAPLRRVNAEALRVLRVFAAKSGWCWGGSLVVGGGLLFKIAARFPFFCRGLERHLSAMADAVRGERGAPRKESFVRPPIPLFVTSFIRNFSDRSAIRKDEREKRAFLEASGGGARY